MSHDRLLCCKIATECTYMFLMIFIGIKWQLYMCVVMYNNMCTCRHNLDLSHAHTHTCTHVVTHSIECELALL